MTQDEQRRQRRRRRATAVAGPPPVPASDASPPPARAAPPGAGRAQPKAKSVKRRDPGERGLRDLVGQGSSQLSVSRALRARDVNRPGPADLAEAAELPIVRRNWQPQS